MSPREHAGNLSREMSVELAKFVGVLLSIDASILDEIEELNQHDGEGRSVEWLVRDLLLVVVELVQIYRDYERRASEVSNCVQAAGGLENGR